MAKESKTPSESVSELAAQTIEQARGAMENYLDFFQTRMFAAPWAETDLNKKIQNYAGKNVATTFEFAQRLTQAKDLQDLVRIQTEFLQTQLNSLTEQTKELSEMATKAAAGALKGPSS